MRMTAQEICFSKNALRAVCKSERLSKSHEEKERLDKRITDRLLSFSAYKHARTVLCYVSTAIEVDTHAIIAHALKDGKTVAVPRCIPGTREMAFYILPDHLALSRGAYGILEPDPLKCAPLTDLNEGLCIVPALMFDKSGFRLGFGKGYYDRFLSRFSGETVGLVYADHFVSKLPHDEFDRRVDTVLSETDIYRITEPTKDLKGGF